MADQTKRMNCPKCGALMNHHGEKLVEPRSAEEARRMQSSPVGLIEEIHACAKCGAVASRAGA